jgi:hypothetical protein
MEPSRLKSGSFFKPVDFVAKPPLEGLFGLHGMQSGDGSSILTAAHPKPIRWPTRPRRLASLTSVDDGAPGRRVAGHLGNRARRQGPGARAFEKMELPEPKGFDKPAHLEAIGPRLRSVDDFRQ